MFSVYVDGSAGVVALIRALHRREGENSTADDGAAIDADTRTSWEFKRLLDYGNHGTRSFPEKLKLLRIFSVSFSPTVPVHSTKGVGLPVAVQWNSARSPCWMEIRDGRMVAVGLVTMPATADKVQCEE